MSPAAKRQPLNVILLGDPAAGKATQAAHLTKRWPLYDLDMGKELRSIQSPAVRKRFKLDKTLDAGKLTPTQLVRAIHQERIARTPGNLGILFDGNPKMIGEARLVHKWMKAAGRERVVMVYLSIPMAETVKRMTGRKEYHRGKFSKRADDNASALKNRVQYYRKNISQVVDYFEKRYPYRRISGLGSRAEVWWKIKEFVKKFE